MGGGGKEGLFNWRCHRGSPADSCSGSSGACSRFSRSPQRHTALRGRSDAPGPEVACADELLGILKAWKQTTEFADAEDWIFASTVKLGRMPLGYTSVWNVLTQTCTRLGIAHVSSHCFRHTYRSWLDALGSPIGLQQRMMRHSSITTTANYGDTVPADLRQAHEKVVQRALQHGNGTEGSTTH